MTDTITTKWEDANGLNFSIALHIASGQSLSDIQNWIDEKLPLLDLVTGGYCTEIYVEQGLTVPVALKDTATANSRRKDAAVINFETGQKAGHSVAIPAVLPTLINGDDIIEAGAVSNFITDYVIAEGAVQAVSDQGVTLTAPARSVSRGTRKYR